METETADCKEMSEVVRVSVIKLFGQTIARPPPPPPHTVVSDDVSFPTSISQDSSKGESGEESVEEKSTSSERSGDDQKKATEKTIPCPRCNSMDTKFCYYNNYNVKQPRHFCKKCQRYWTSGGTMRNVPVGSGRRKSKNTLFPSHPHIMVPEGGGGASLKANALVVSTPGFPVSFYPATLYWAAGADGGSVLGKHWRGGAVIRPSSNGAAMVLQANPPKLT